MIINEITQLIEEGARLKAFGSGISSGILRRLNSVSSTSRDLTRQLGINPDNLKYHNVVRNYIKARRHEDWDKLNPKTKQVINYHLAGQTAYHVGELGALGIGGSYVKDSYDKAKKEKQNKTNLKIAGAALGGVAGAALGAKALLNKSKSKHDSK